MALRCHFNEHWVGANGNPAGGVSSGRGFTISWQNGPLSTGGVRREPNGAFVEDVIQAVIRRIEFYQSSQFRCDENADADALGFLQEAARRLDDRTKDRESRLVEGTHQI